MRDKEKGLLRPSKAMAAYHPGRGVYRSAYKNARRLAATETNIAYRTADYQRLQGMEFVVGVRIVLSNNHTCLNSQGKPERFTDICDDLQGDYPKDFKFTGWHPHCRCHVETILKTDEELAADTARLLNGEPPITGSANEVSEPPEAFQAWCRDNAQRIKDAKKRGTLPYFIRDNAAYISKHLDDNQFIIDASLTKGDILKVNSAPLAIKDPTNITDEDVKHALTNFATANPSLFNGGLADVKIKRDADSTEFMANTRKHSTKTGAFIKSEGNTLYIIDKDFIVAPGVIFNPLREVKGALKVITEKRKLTFKQEYALEGVWHEIRHAGAVGWKNRNKKTDHLRYTMETINQFCARISYPNFIKGLGGKASHQQKVMARGYGYKQRVSNFCTLLKKMRVSKKDAYSHFKDRIIKTPYEDIHGELVSFIVSRSKYSAETASDIVNIMGYWTDEFKRVI